jgi:hypothetical protein
MSFKLQPNELVSVLPWDCEGIENPWGWFPDKPPPKRSESPRRFNKVKISPSATGIVIEEGSAVTDDFDEHYVVLVEGKALSVPIRFLHKV